MNSLPSHEEVWDAHTILSSFGISERVEARSPETAPSTNATDMDGVGDAEEEDEDLRADRQNQLLIQATFKKIELLIPLFLLLVFRLISQVWVHVRFILTLSFPFVQLICHV